MYMSSTQYYSKSYALYQHNTLAHFSVVYIRWLCCTSIYAAVYTFIPFINTLFHNFRSILPFYSHSPTNVVNWNLIQFNLRRSQYYPHIMYEQTVYIQCVVCYLKPPSHPRAPQSMPPGRCACSSAVATDNRG